jgi:phosphatidylserine/phosphatidylglycerophosphate/cardiolipin synthase-like enzyme
MPSMLGRSALASASATAASLVVVVLAVAGCKVQVPSAAQASAGTTGAVQAGTSGVTREGSLVVEPGAGFSSVYNLIDGAKRSIDVTMYEFSDTTAEHDLAAAAKRGVHVHVILDQREHSENSAAYSYFGKVFIGSENFSNTSLNDNRELGLIISSHAVMSAIAGTFASDFRNGQHWS